MAAAAELAMLIQARDVASQTIRRLEGTMQRFKATVDETTPATDRLGNATERAGNTAVAAGSKMGNLNSSMSSLNTMMGRVGATAMGIVSAMGIMAAIRMPGDLISSALTAYAAFERLNLSLQNLVAVEIIAANKSITMSNAMELAGDRAQELTRWTQRLAIESPFTQDTIAKTLQMAMGYGMNSQMAQQLTRALTDFSAATGRSEAQTELLGLALGQVWAKGRLTGEEMRQLTNAGMGVEFVARAAGLSMEQFADTMRDGAIDARTLVPALIALTDERFAGAARRQATSWAGLLSTMEDITNVGLREFFSGTFQAIQPYAERFVETFGSEAFFERLNSLGQILGEQVGNALQVVGNAMSWISDNIMPMLSDALVFVTENWDAFKGAILGVATFLSGGVISAAIGAVIGLLGALVGAISLPMAAAALLGAAWSANWGGIRDILTNYWQNSIRPALELLGRWLGENLPRAIGVLKRFWMDTLLPALRTITTFIQDNIFPVFERLLQWLNDNLPSAIEVLSRFWNENLYPALRAIWRFIQENLLPILGTLVTVGLAVLSAAVSALAWVWNNVLHPALSLIWRYISEALLPILGALVDLGLAVVEASVRVLADVWANVLEPALRGVWEIIEQNVLPIFREIANFVNDHLLPPFRELASFISDVLLARFNDLIETARNLVDWIRRIADAIRNLPGLPTPPDSGGGDGGGQQGLAGYGLRTYRSGALDGSTLNSSQTIINNNFTQTIYSNDSGTGAVTGFQIMKSMAGA